MEPLGLWQSGEFVYWIIGNWDFVSVGVTGGWDCWIFWGMGGCDFDAVCGSADDGAGYLSVDCIVCGLADQSQ